MYSPKDKLKKRITMEDIIEKSMFIILFGTLFVLFPMSMFGIFKKQPNHTNYEVFQGKKFLGYAYGDIDSGCVRYRNPNENQNGIVCGNFVVKIKEK